MEGVSAPPTSQPGTPFPSPFRGPSTPWLRANLRVPIQWEEGNPHPRERLDTTVSSRRGEEGARAQAHPPTAPRHHPPIPFPSPPPPIPVSNPIQKLDLALAGAIGEPGDRLGGVSPSPPQPPRTSRGGPWGGGGEFRAGFPRQRSTSALPRVQVGVSVPVRCCHGWGGTTAWGGGLDSPAGVPPHPQVLLPLPHRALRPADTQGLITNRRVGALLPVAFGPTVTFWGGGTDTDTRDGLLALTV